MLDSGAGFDCKGTSCIVSYKDKSGKRYLRTLEDRVIKMPHCIAVMPDVQSQVAENLSRTLADMNMKVVDDRPSTSCSVSSVDQVDSSKGSSKG
ncbi:hypothetical protein [Wolbachia endosymbiont of Ctenocephalides felis wCfeT]|uniref:hypothetical protein n=1 Tax=Wolbachia endosymbiont of Ctenocephalides felis wCfeT TaxID=2732593 RepID=UPI001445E919|nr:hypothetical protein [Wolbachia endosymbiont of Ctenocephalides felis wCfeT]